VGRQSGGALIYIDLDDFKQVNDSAGHKVGDELLTKTAKLLQDQVREGDLAGRLGGDEFALFLDGIGRDSVIARTEALQAAWASEVQSADLGAKIGSLSIGIALIDGETRESARSLIERGDRAMYRVKHSGKDGYALSAAASCVEERA
jgi:diguanylate cyclase (GGDEF)-like protein